MKVFVVLEIGMRERTPKIISIHKTRKAAEKAAYETPDVWRNVIETELQE